jgi:predicted NBD/HSP70 family sugar kinase
MRGSPARAGRAKNRGLVLDLIRGARTVSRVGLAADSGLTTPAISQIVRELIADELVIEVGRGVSTGGKRPTLLRVNPQGRYSVGVQLERNTSVVVIVDLTGRTVARDTFAGIASLPPGRAIRLVVSRVEKLLRTAGVDRRRVLGVGLVSYGPQDVNAGVLLSPQPTQAWQGYPIAQRMSEILHLPVRLENDANAAAIGEYWLGGVPPECAFGCIYMASGIGGGVVIAGHLYRGSSSNTVEVGHISINVNGDGCTCGNRGCLENYAGPTAVVNLARATPRLRRRLRLDPDTIDILADFTRVTTASATGDPDAQALVEQSARYLGNAAATLTTLFDLDLIVLAGPGFGPATNTYQTLMQHEVDRCSFARRAHPTRVIASTNGSDGAAIGGAVLVLHGELITPASSARVDTRHLRPPQTDSAKLTD